MSGGPTLLAFDFDGALAPLRDEPADARMDRAAAALVRHVSRMERVTVAVVSGRDADDVAGRIDAPGAYIIASHGLEIRDPGGAVVRDAPPLVAALPASLASELEKCGLRVETKKHGVAVHWRGVDAETIEPLIDHFRAWADGAGLDLVEGSCVVEARCRGGRKTDALRWLMTATGATRLIYAAHNGDDVAALRFASECGRAVSVRPQERLAIPGVVEVDSFRHVYRLVRQEVMV